MFTSLGNSIPRNGLVGEWLLDGNALDTSGNGNNGTNSNGVYVKTYKGYQNKAWQGNGSASTNINIPFTALGNGTYSFSFIFKSAININNGDYNYILDFSTQSVIQNRFSIRVMPTIYGGFLRVYVRGGGSETYRDSLLVLNDDKYHIGYVYVNKSTSTINIYIDGILNQSVQYGGVIGTVSTNNSFRIGSYHDGNTVGGFLGDIQNLRIYNRELTQDEIQLLYLEGQKLLGPTNIAKYPKLFEGLVGYWDFRGTAHNLVDGVLATVSGATLTTDRFGNSNSAYSFNGTTDRIIGGGINFNGGIMSMGAYVKFNGTGDYCIMSETSITNFIKYGIYYYGSTNTIYFNRTKNNVGANNATYVTNLGTSDWHHLFMTYDGTNIRGYLDGNLVNTASASGNGTTSGINGIGIGVMYKEGTPTYENYTNGIIGTVFYLNKTLSSDEVKALYELTSQDYIYPNPSYDLPNLRDGLILDLNEQGKDLSGNGNNGTLVNSPTVVRQGKAKGLSYNGSSNYLYAPIGSLNTNYSISFSLKGVATPTTTPVKYPLLLTNGGVSGFIFSYNESTPKTFYVVNTSGTFFGYTLPELIAGKYYNYTITVGGGFMKVYVNGNYSGQVAYTGTLRTISQLEIGRFIGTSQYWDGIIINPKFYNRVLNPIEASQLFYGNYGNFIY